MKKILSMLMLLLAIWIVHLTDGTEIRAISVNTGRFQYVRIVDEKGVEHIIPRENILEIVRVE